MRNEYLNKVEDNSSGNTEYFWEMKDIWAQLDDEARQLFFQTYGDLSYLLDIMGYRTYVRPATLPTFTKKLVMITGMSEQWAIARVQQKGDSKGIPWTLLLVWFHSHFWKLEKVPCRVFFEGYSPLKETATTSRRDDITEERWMDILHNLREEEVLWKAPWMTPNEALYRCGNFDWVPLLGIWGVVGYAPPSKHDERKLVVHGRIHDIIARDSIQQRHDERKPEVHEGIYDLIANEDYPRVGTF
ncbi:hypothetical protein CXB51_024478 [Gossypium anomalum]|uniref:DUF7745 domain-containing protein n=1 Tax=Gossypium anomalum TaxID=47600 RepID=A0A8J5YME2_9ROSI|nr:hypothetical protein CXB51_024478 [Gossypium anomalum]